MRNIEKIVYTQQDGQFRADDGAGNYAACSPGFVARIAFTALDAILKTDEAGCDCISCNVMKAARAILKIRGAIGGDAAVAFDKSKLC